MAQRNYERHQPLLYSPENDPHYARQVAFFSGAFSEAAQLEPSTKIKKGPFFDDFAQIMNDVGAQLTALDDTFTPEYLAPSAYQSKEVSDDIRRHPEVAQKLAEIKRRQRVMFNDLAKAITPKMALQNIPDGMLNTPGYRRTVEGWDHPEAARGCSNACFRMIYEGITGSAPSQAALSDCLIEQYGTSIVHDSVYAGVYQTEAFRGISNYRVLTVDVIGADFAVINNLAAKVKQPTRPDAKVFCTVSIVAPSTGEAAVHTVVLLGADGKNVRYHDPNYQVGGRNTELPYDVFMRRWIGAYNKAQLTIAVPQ